MNPFFFGDAARQLYGAYHPATVSSRRGAVLCNPWGREYLLSHSTFRVLASQLAASGCHTLRFDYSGTGDSAGASEEVRHEQWLADTAAAVDELKDLSGADDIALVGMRHGAAIAALIARRRTDVRRVVLWDPVFDGKRYLSELGTSATTVLPEEDVNGTVLTQPFREDITGITPATFAQLPTSLVLSTTSPDAFTPLVQQLRTSGTSCEVAHVDDVQVWREEWGTGGKGLAVSAAGRVVHWLAS